VNTSSEPRPRGPQRNRVTPLGDIVAEPLRGAWCGNRGILHRGHDVVRCHAGQLWITCALSFKDWRLPQWEPHHFTLLFFHDEAVSLAAGHRPCALCRRPDYRAYRTAVESAAGLVPRLAKDLDAQLHAERLHRGTHRRRFHELRWSELPDATFVLLPGGPAIVLGAVVVPWTSAGYGEPQARPHQRTATVITPLTSVHALAGGYRPQLDAALPTDPISSTAGRSAAG
jgi:hypothetical protein